MEKGRMNKRAFLDTLAEKNGLSVQQVEQAYDMIIGGIVDVVRDGYRLNLMGFGSYYKQWHKGQPVQFHSTAKRRPDYEVFKFSASNTLNRSLRRG